MWDTLYKHIFNSGNEVNIQVDLSIPTLPSNHFDKLTRVNPLLPYTKLFKSESKLQLTFPFLLSFLNHTRIHHHFILPSHQEEQEAQPSD